MSRTSVARASSREPEPPSSTHRIIGEAGHEIAGQHRLPPLPTSSATGDGRAALSLPDPNGTPADDRSGRVANAHECVPGNDVDTVPQTLGRHRAGQVDGDDPSLTDDDVPRAQYQSGIR
jgi:hypothetical protein